MPELPDLLYICSYLRPALCGRTIVGLEVLKPVVLRVAMAGPAAAVVGGQRINEVDVHGPFLCLRVTGGIDIVINLMLAGRVQHQTADSRSEPYLCVAFLLDDGSRLRICDEKTMAKVYLVPHGDYSRIPRYGTQGLPVLAPEFTPDRFLQLARRHGRKQVRVFLNDQTILSAIGNAYADEILFEARIHPKTFVARLSEAEVLRLHAAIGSVLAWGHAEVKRTGMPIHVKVRGHLRVRNRHGEACPRCGATIRREGVRGYDVFYCPACQPASRRLFLDWRAVSRGSSEGGPSR
jgi:formamidopyrimidine-DNA glycosylase